MSKEFEAFTDLSDKLNGTPVSPTSLDQSVDAPEPALVDPSIVNPKTEQLAADATAKSIPQPPIENVAQPSPVQPQIQSLPAPPQQLPILQQQTNFTSGQKLSEPLLAEQSRAQEAVNKAVIQQADVQALKAQNESLALQEQQAELVRRDQANQAEQARIKEDQDKQMALFQTSLDERKSYRMDPKRYWDNLPAGSKIASVLGLALGAFGSALSRSPNYAQQMFDNAIERDMKAQQIEYQKLGDQVDDAKNMYAFFRQRGLDSNSAYLASKASYLESARAKIDAIASQSKSQEVKANAQLLTSQFDKQYQDVLAQQYLAAQGKAVTQTVRGMPQGASMSDQLHLRELEVNVPQANGTTKVYLAKSGKSADDIRKAQTVAKSVKSNLLEMKKLIKETSQSISPSAKAQVSTLADQLRTQFAVLNNLGALSDKDYSIASQLGDPTSLLQRDSTTLKLIDDWHGRIDKDMMSHYESQGLIGTNTVGK